MLIFLTIAFGIGTMLALLLFGVAIVLITILWSFFNRDKYKDEPPLCFGSKILLGHGLLLTGTSTQLWSNLIKITKDYMERGGALKLKVGFRTLYVLTNPEDCTIVSNICTQKDSIYEFAKPWVGDGLVTSSALRFKPFMERLLELAHDTNAFTDREIKEHVDTMLVAGHDTFATALVFNMMFVGANPQVQEKIHEELKCVFGDEDRDVTNQDLSQLVYLEAAIKESLRLYPSVPIVGRLLTQDIKLRNCTLYKGNSVFMSISSVGTHRHSVWGPDAEVFRPERWLDPSTLPESPNASVSFGLGRRNCIGKILRNACNEDNYGSLLPKLCSTRRPFKPKAQDGCISSTDIRILHKNRK